MQMESRLIFPQTQRCLTKTTKVQRLHALHLKIES